MNGPLEGIRVIDMTVWQQGPTCTRMLGDLGADVIKVEERTNGDPGRGLQKIMDQNTGVGGKNWYYEGNNRNKRGIALDLKKEKGRQIVYRLVEKSDVFITNFRRDVPPRLGMDYDTLCKHNPKIVYGLASGFGPEGPDSEQPCFDYLGQARSGFMSAIGEPSEAPIQAQVGIADEMGGIMLAYAIMVALFAREKHGIGQMVEASQLGSMMALQGLAMRAYLITGKEFRKHCRAQAGNALWNHYRCSDGEWIVLGMNQSDRYWSRFCKVIEIPELEKDPRFANAERRSENCEELVKILDKLFATKPKEQWLRILSKDRDFVFTQVNSYPDLLNDPQVLANNYIVEYDHPSLGKINMPGVPIHMSKTPGSIRLPAPELGQHTEEILIDLCNYTWEEIEQLKEEEVII